MPQPKVNWWPGNLRPYESPESFLARFCELNGIELRKAQAYFRYLVWSTDPASASDIDWFAMQLNEPLSVVQTFLAPTLGLHFGGKRPTLRREEPYVRYCPSCASWGYHSRLHEQPWLVRCIFHGEELRKDYGDGTGKSALDRRINVVKKIMTERCKTWPKGAKSQADILALDSFQRFAEWNRQVRIVFSSILKGTLWSLDEDVVGETPSEQYLLGQYHAMVPVPEILKPSFVPFDDGWEVGTYRFPINVKDDIAQLGGNLPFALLYRFFKQICIVAPTRRVFAQLYDNALRDLDDRHGRCHCRWGFGRTRSNGTWKTTDPEGWPYWDAICPYEYAKRELRQEMGDFDAMPSYQSANEKTVLFGSAPDLAERGYIGYTPEASVSPYGRALMDPWTWPSFEWVDQSVLTQVLEAIGESEIQARHKDTMHWLDQIDQGARPERTDAQRTGVIIHASAETVTVVGWRRKQRLGLKTAPSR